MTTSTRKVRVVAVLDGATATGDFGGAVTAGSQSNAVRRRIFDAIRSEAPAIAEPLLAQAIADGTITQAEADRIRARLSARRVPLGRRRKRSRAWRPGVPRPAAA